VSPQHYHYILFWWGIFTFGYSAGQLCTFLFFFVFFCHFLSDDPFPVLLLGEQYDYDLFLFGTFSFIAARAGWLVPNLDEYFVRQEGKALQDHLMVIDSSL
jgi:hypothetical protein